MTDDRARAEERLRKEVAALPVPEILSLCYAFQHSPERLRLYLDVLRKQGGERAQFASCLICFDLARQGETSFQQEFIFLADTMTTLAQDAGLVSTLVGGDPYLSFLWELCQAHLAEMDPRFEVAQMEAEASDFVAVDLLSDDDFTDLPDFDVTVEDSTLWMRFDQAVEDFLGGEVGMPIYDPDAGFRARSGRDIERIESFLRELESMRDLIPISRGFRSLVLMFYGVHMRSKKLFGAINQRKQSLLREGIQEFVASGPQLWGVAGVLGPMHAPPGVWEKISDILLDYVRWLSEPKDNPTVSPFDYDAVGRLTARQPFMGNRRGGSRG